MRESREETQKRAPSPINNYEGEAGIAGQASLNAFNQCHRANFRSPFLAVAARPLLHCPLYIVVMLVGCLVGSLSSSRLFIYTSKCWPRRTLSDVCSLAGNYQRPKLHRRKFQFINIQPLDHVPFSNYTSITNLFLFI